MIAVVWACDVAVGASSTQFGPRDTHPCPATSRAAGTEDLLRAVAGRDGWLVLADGTHRCPFHAGATT